MSACNSCKELSHIASFWTVYCTAYGCQLGSSSLTGNLCQENINECASSPCLNHGTCVDGVASFTCRCEPPYSGPICAEEPCSPNPCANNAACVHSFDYRGFKCTCPPGWKGESAEQSSCQSFSPGWSLLIHILSTQVSYVTLMWTSAAPTPARTMLPVPTCLADMCAPAAMATRDLIAKLTSTTVTQVSNRYLGSCPELLSHTWFNFLTQNQMFERKV